MTTSRIERRVFVVGVPRSGTTLVQSLLAAHAAMTSFTESHFFSRHFTPLPALASAILTRDPAPRLRAFLAENGVAADAAGGERRRPRFLLPFATRSEARRLLAALDRIALSRGRTGWIEKTPRHLRFVPFLERISDRTSFVHVIRDGLEAVASLHRASQSWQRPYDLATCVARWNADVAFSLRRAASAADRFVFYEDLTSRPEAALERLFAGLGLDWRPEILERYSADGLITAEETWKAGVGRGVRRPAPSGGGLSEAQRKRVRAALRRDLYARLRERAR